MKWWYWVLIIGFFFFYMNSIKYFESIIILSILLLPILGLILIPLMLIKNQADKKEEEKLETQITEKERMEEEKLERQRKQEERMEEEKLERQRKQEESINSEIKKRNKSYLKSSHFIKTEKKSLDDKIFCLKCHKRYENTFDRFLCHYCDNYYCSSHRLPENHNCKGNLKSHSSSLMESYSKGNLTARGK